MANPVKVRTFGLIPTVAKPFTMARKRCPQVSPIFLVIMMICPKQARGARSSQPPPRGSRFPFVLRLAVDHPVGGTPSAPAPRSDYNQNHWQAIQAPTWSRGQPGSNADVSSYGKPPCYR